jgi:hypothetical protein
MAKREKKGNTSERKQEIISAMDKFLPIPKQQRLISADGKIHLPAVPDRFYLSEVAKWLSFSEEFAKRNSKNRKSDYTIESRTYEPLKEVAFALDESPPGVYTLPGQDRVTLMELYQPLDKELILNSELVGVQNITYSYSHHRFLNSTIRKVQENQGAFISILSDVMKHPLGDGAHYYSDALNLLRKIHRSLLKLEEEGLYNIIPMLFALRDHGALMAFDLNEVFKYEIEEWGLLYSYGFSSHTSYNFLVLIKDFIARSIRQYEQLLNKTPSDISYSAPQVTDDSKQFFIPPDTKGKVALIRKILNLEVATNSSKKASNSEEQNEALELTPFQIMVLLRAMQDKGFLKSKIEKYQFALAYHIITGSGPSYFERQFETGELTLARLKRWSKKKLNKAVHQSIKELEEKLANEIIPYLKKLLDLK